jgi:type IV pilus assembly protein PilA
MKMAFTLIELLAVIIIVGVLVALAVPNYTKAVERTKAQQAISYLKIIAGGEQMYWDNNSTYVECANSAEIRSILGVDISEEAYTFVVGKGVTNNIIDSFIATATRKTDPSKTITIDQNGDIVENWE